MLIVLLLFVWALIGLAAWLLFRAVNGALLWCLDRWYLREMARLERLHGGKS